MTHFAERRLAHFGLDLQSSNDLVQQAIFAILRGISGNGGRNPNPADLENRAAFQNYLRGVISSVAEGWARTHRREGKNTYAFDLIQESFTDPVNTQENLEFSDLKTELFSRLRERAPDRLLPTIDAWEKMPDGRIPCITSRKHVCSVRQLAKEIVLELGYGPTESPEDDPGDSEEQPDDYAAVVVEGPLAPLGRPAPRVAVGIGAGRRRPPSAHLSSPLGAVSQWSVPAADNRFPGRAIPGCT